MDLMCTRRRTLTYLGLVTTLLGAGCQPSRSADPETPADAGSTDATSETTAQDPQDVTASTAPPALLSEWGLFADGPAQLPAADVVPYDVIAPLFSDYTHKRRFLRVPAGQTIGYHAREVWRFPVGSVLVKTFSYLNDRRAPALGERLLETRLLVRETEGWVGHTYVWNEAQTDAERKVAGALFETRWVHDDGSERENLYGVPNTNECHDCHGKKPALDTLGLRTRQIDRDFDHGDGPINQIDHLLSLGLFDRTPGNNRQQLVDPFGDAPLFERARAYLDVNCGACHREGGEASSSSMYNAWEYTDPIEGDPEVWGACRIPDSASGANCGLRTDIIPGEPDASIYICRLESEMPEVRMPPLARRLQHTEGVALMRAWIAALDGACD